MHIEFTRDALLYLQRQFPDMERKLVTTEQVNRWFSRFGHLDFATWCQAVDAYADEHDRRPTVTALASCLPRGQSSRGGRKACAHLWDTLGDGNQMCHHCGIHHQDCRCAACLCGMDGHGDVVTHADGTRWCPSCERRLRQVA